jgi:hypothetical protein
MTISLTLDFSEKCAALQSTLELHLSGLTGTVSHLDTQKIRITGFFSENRLHWQFEVRMLLFTVCTCVETFRPRLIWSSNNNNNNNFNSNWFCHSMAVVILHVHKTWNWLLINLSREGYMRSMSWQLRIMGTISAFAYRHKETKKNLSRGGRSQDLPNTDF